MYNLFEEIQEISNCVTGSTPAIPCVYFIHFKLKDSFYIGSTIDLERRWGEHCSQMILGNHFNYLVQNTYNYYSEIIDLYCIPCKLEDRLSLEQSFLDKYFENNGCLNLSKSVYGPGTTNNIEVHQYKLSGEYVQSFNSIYDAAKSVNVDNSTLAYLIRGRGKTCAGFQWSSKKIDCLPKFSYCNDLEYDFWICKYGLDGKYVEKYNSIKGAADVHNISDSGIHIVLNNPEKSAAGFRWMKYNKKEIIPTLIKAKTPVQFNKIKQLTLTGELVHIFNNAIEAAISLGRRKLRCKIHEVCQGKANTCKGYKWEYDVI